MFPLPFVHLPAADVDFDSPLQRVFINFIFYEAGQRRVSLQPLDVGAYLVEVEDFGSVVNDELFKLGFGAVLL